MDRTKFIITQWHLLEFLWLNERNGKVTTKDDVKEQFKLPNGECTVRLFRLQYYNNFISIKDKNIFLTKKAKLILKNNGATSFLDLKNPAIKKAKERARKLNKIFLPYVRC